jgi:phosphoserine phosphatase RsbU/P
MSVDSLIEEKTVKGEDDSVRYCYFSEASDGKNNGDFSGVKKLKDERTLFYVGDVSGHGDESVSSFAKNLKGTIEHAAEIKEGLKTSELARIINSMPMQKNKNGTELFVTTFIAIYDPKTRTINYTNAGHGPVPLYFPDIRNPEESFNLKSEDFFIGIFPQHKYEDYTIILRNVNNSMIFMATDGITERENFQREQFGEKKFMPTLLNNIHKQEDQLVGNVLSDSYSFGLPKQEFEDDVSLMAMTIKQ